MGKSGEKQNSLTRPEKEQTIEDIVKGYRRLGYSEETIEEIRADLLDDLQKELFKAEKHEILEGLKENKCVEIEENVNYMGYKGKKVHINLPKIEGKFEGFRFEYFVSYDSVCKKDFESKPELEDKSYSMKDVGGLLGAMNKYMQARGVETDGDMNYENDLKHWETRKSGCYAGDCLKQIVGLDCAYWLKDKDVGGVKDSRAKRGCNVGLHGFHSFCCFDCIAHDDFRANLFLRLS